MVVEGKAVFSLSSVLWTQCCLVLLFSVKASFSSMALFVFKRVFTVGVKDCSAISADESLCNVGALYIIFGSSSVLIPFSDENERRILTLLSPQFKLDVFSVFSEFDVRLNLFETSAIVLNVPAGSLPHCIMGNVDKQCRIHVTREDSKLTTSSCENAVHTAICANKYMKTCIFVWGDGYVYT